MHPANPNAHKELASWQRHHSPPVDSFTVEAFSSLMAWNPETWVQGKCCTDAVAAAAAEVPCFLVRKTKPQLGLHLLKIFSTFMRNETSSDSWRSCFTFGQLTWECRGQHSWPYIPQQNFWRISRKPGRCASHPLWLWEILWVWFPWAPIRTPCCERRSPHALRALPALSPSLVLFPTSLLQCLPPNVGHFFWSKSSETHRDRETESEREREKCVCIPVTMTVRLDRSTPLATSSAVTRGPKTPLRFKPENMELRLWPIFLSFFARISLLDR